MKQTDWDRFYHSGKVEDYLRYRHAENRAAAAITSTGLVKPALPWDADDDEESLFLKPSLPVDAEQEYADQNGWGNIKDSEL